MELNRGNAASGQGSADTRASAQGTWQEQGPRRARLALELGRRALGLAGRAVGALGDVVGHAVADLLGALGRRPGVLGHLAGRVLDRAAHAARRLRRPTSAASAQLGGTSKRVSAGGCGLGGTAEKTY